MWDFINNFVPYMFGGIFFCGVGVYMLVCGIKMLLKIL